MDKSWIHEENRVSERYLEGLAKFLEFALKSSSDGKLVCPCIKCDNRRRLSKEAVTDHLLNHGFSQSYTEWYLHGESKMESAHHTPSPLHHGHNEVNIRHNVGQFLNDMIVGGGLNSTEDNHNICDDQPDGEKLNEETEKFYRLLKENNEPLFDGCTKHSKLSYILDLYHKKCMHGWSNKSFNELLDTQRETFGLEYLPKSSYEVKKLIGELGLEYKKIHVCPNNCMLFWKDREDDSSCHICGASRWVEDGNHSDGGSSKMTKRKLTPKKVLRWFPLKPRLQRLFMCSKTASAMRWHFDERTEDGFLRHPADARAWKEFDSLHKDFSKDPRNVRLGLASDGFNPFRNMSVTHSTWPVILTVYNFPPWMCMKQPSFILSLLISGPDSPSDKIDVLLQPLIDELKDLWENGLETYDADSKSTFHMRAALMWTINDFPAYGMLSGWNTKKKFACPCCGFETDSEWLNHGGKYCFLGHRRFLPLDHPYRSDTHKFNGHVEMRQAPTLPIGAVALCQLNGEITVKDKDGNDVLISDGWSRKSIFFELPYWKSNLIRHNLDVMHIEKNVYDNIMGTLLDVDGKTKDNLKSRFDLQRLGIRSELHSIELENGKFSLPPACYTMSNGDKDQMLGGLKAIKVPDGYSSNISRCVRLKQRKLIGLKSHDCHILMEDLLPIVIRGVVEDNVATAIIELCTYFKEICSKILKVSRLQELEVQIGETLSRLEMIFPPSFFTIMVHSVVHLATEARLAGPVHYRWMYPIERYLSTLKSYMKNRNYPEGSIAEGYIADECITCCSRYFEGVETRFNRPVRNDDGGVLSPVVDAPLQIIQGCPFGKVENVVLDDQTRMQAHRYVLYNCDLISPFRKKHRDEIRGSQRRQNRKRRKSNQSELDQSIEKEHHSTFTEWIKKHVAVLKDMKDPTVTDHLEWLARGPNTLGRRFMGYNIGGLKFRTKESEQKRKSQNSGIVISTQTSSSDEDVVYYGVLQDIIELNYYDTFRVVLFKCDWVDVERGKGVKRDQFGFTLVNLSKLVHTGVKSADEPFVLASQVKQVFYVQDSLQPEWHVVVRANPRDVYDMGEKLSSAST